MEINIVANINPIDSTASANTNGKIMHIIMVNSYRASEHYKELGYLISILLHLIFTKACTVKTKRMEKVFIDGLMEIFTKVILKTI